MLNLFEIITIPLGYIIDFIYQLVKNYGVAIIIFTIIVKLILLPLTYKSQKSMKKQQKIQPIIAELQKKYANDQQKLQQEMMKVYKENDVSMMGGCLPLLIQMPILIGLYRVIQRPITYLLHINISDAGVTDKITNIVKLMSEKFPDVVGKIANQSPEVLFKNYQIQLATWSEKVLDKADAWKINFNFLGLDLSKVPSASIGAIMKGDFKDIAVIALILIPILAAFTTWLSMKLSQATAPAPNNDAAAGENQAAQMTNSMSAVMPIMTGVFAFSLPSGMGIYWIVSNVVQLIQQYLLNKHFNTKEDDFVVKLPNKNRKTRKKHR